MPRNHSPLPVGTGVLLGTVLLSLSIAAWAQTPPKNAPPAPPHDAIADFQTPRSVPETRPEQKKSEHDKSGVFSAKEAEPSSSALGQQPDQYSEDRAEYDAYIRRALHRMQLMGALPNAG